MDYTPPNIIDSSGAINSVYPCTEYLTFGYWIYCVPQYKPKNVLLLGVAGGTVAGLIKKLYGEIPITGVDIEDCPNYYDIDFVKADAKDYVKNCEKFDCVIVDTYRAEDVGMCEFATTKEFVEDLRKIANYIIVNAQKDTDMSEYGKPLRVIPIDELRVHYFVNNRVPGLPIR